MLFTMVALWIITIILLVSDAKSVNTRWAAALTFTAGVGGLSRVIKDMAIPGLLEYNLSNPDLIDVLNSVHYVCSFITQNFVPYTFLMFAVYYSSMFKKKTRRVLAFTLLIPIIFMLYLTTIRLTPGTPFKIIIIWVIPYTLIGSAILIYSYIMEKNPILKRDRALTNIMAIIPMIFVLFANYIASANEHRNLFRFNVCIIFILFISFVAFIFKYGVIGIKIRVERSRDYDETIKAINSGTGILAIQLRMSCPKYPYVLTMLVTTKMQR